MLRNYSLKIAVFWGMTSTQSVISYRHFGSACCLLSLGNRTHQHDIINLKSAIFTANAQKPLKMQSAFVYQKIISVNIIDVTLSV
jgi:Cys-tRNA synthase (O-phospho-L-seryl-tRNA:Cys-tRNA synthase)